MNDYFDRVEQELRAAAGRRAHMPWYLRLRPRPSRPLVVLVACLVVATGSALAATGVFRTGSPVGAEVQPISDANEGVAIPGSIHVLALRVADPDGGPPWGLRVEKTTRGLMCVQAGRVVDGRIGVLGQDGAFGDDGAFHPLSADLFSGLDCGTEDARGDAFLNEQDHGIPASGLTGDARHASGGCYAASAPARSCPPSARREVLFGLLGPDAVSITHETADGASVTTPTAGSDGAYLIVLPDNTRPCARDRPFCVRGQGGSTGGPTLEPSEVIRAVSYRGAPSCRLLTPAEVTRLQAVEGAKLRAMLRVRLPAIYRAVYRDERYAPGSLARLTPRQDAAFEALRGPYLRAGDGMTCPPVGYVAAPSQRIAPARVASPVSVHADPARHYCERRERTEPCDGRVPAGYRRIDMRGGPPELLLVIEFTARAAVTSFDSHYEINVSDPSDPSNRQCPGPGGGSFGPTQSDLRAGERVRYTMFVNPRCRGVSHITVGFVTVDGPSGAMPVPGLPGQSAEIPVGQTDFRVP
jgi:hypothetical protein